MNADEFALLCRETAPLLAGASARAPVLAAQRLNLAVRHENLFLGTRSGGKSSICAHSPFGRDPTICERGGFFDPDSAAQSDRYLHEIQRVMLSMFRQQRIQRNSLPLYRPKIFLRPETWWRIENSFLWVPKQSIAEMSFPKQSIYDALTEAGVSAEAQAFFSPQWLEYFCDATGKLMPGLAFDAMQRTVQLGIAPDPKTNALEKMWSQAKWKGAARACAAFVEQQKDVAYWLVFMAPDEKSIYMRKGFFTVPYERMIIRLRQARVADRARKLPFGLTGPEFIQYMRAAGICTMTKFKYLHFAMPYAIGASYLKHVLTTAAMQDKLSSL